MRPIAMIWLLALLCISPLCAAEGPFPSAPVYDPSSKSYFQLFADNINPGTWEAAKTRAGSRSYKGVRGRLAVVGNYETHKFILRTFELTRREDAVWIGLRYWCSARLLQWEGNRPYSPSDPGHFKMWHSQWSRADDQACSDTRSGKLGFAPVSYRTIGSVTRWQAAGAAKFFNHYLVEYPTGEE